MLNDRFEWKMERLRRGIKLKDIAHILRVTPSHVCMYEGSKADMAIDKVQRYKRFINEFDQ